MNWIQQLRDHEVLPRNVELVRVLGVIESVVGAVGGVSMSTNPETIYICEVKETAYWLKEEEKVELWNLNIL